MRLHPDRWLLIAVLMAPSAQVHAQASARILVQSSPLAGFQFHEGKALWEQMKVGDALTLVREPDNVHDPRAVRVEWQGQKLGYVPRKENEAVARQLDRGNKLEARIVQLRKHRDPWKRVEFEIFLKLQTLSPQRHRGHREKPQDAVLAAQHLTPRKRTICWTATNSISTLFSSVSSVPLW